MKTETKRKYEPINRVTARRELSPTGRRDRRILRRFRGPVPKPVPTEGRLTFGAYLALGICGIAGFAVGMEFLPPPEWLGPGIIVITVLALMAALWAAQELKQ